MRIDDWRMEQAWAEPEAFEPPAAEAAPPAPPPPPAPAPSTPPEPPPLPFWAEGTPVPQSLLERLPAAQLQAPAEAAASTAAAPAAAPAPAPAAPAPTGYVGEPPADAAWLAQREAAFTAIRSDYEAARSLAQSQPQIAGTPGWTATQPSTDESGQLPQQQAGSLVFIPSADTTPVVVGYDESGPVYSQPAGQWLAFDEAAFAQAYQAQGGAPLQSLARLYDSTPAALLGAHPELWSIATTDHALNAGPPPAGRAMGDATQLGMVDLYMADPQVAKLIDAFGGSAAPATSGIAKEQARIYGEARYEQLSRLGNAMQSVRDQYSNALANAAAGGSTAGWVEREVTTTTYDESGGQQTTSLQRSFDPDAFTAWYIAQDGLANQAFRDFYGQSHTTSNGTDESGQSMGSTITFDNPNWTMSGIGGGMTHTELVRIDPNAPPRLNNDGAVGFDLEAGWATPQGNIHQKKDWFETVVQVAAVAVVGYFTAGAASAWATGAGWGATGAAVAGGVAAGAATATVSGVMNGNLAFKDILRGALAGGLSGGLLAEYGGVVAQNYGAVGTVALRTTVQGGIQALLGGSFKDGAIAGFASGLAEVAGSNIKANIDKAVAAGTMSAAEAATARTFARVLGSAIRAAGSPGDPAQAMASAFLSDVLDQADPGGFRQPVVTAPPAGPPPDPFAAAEAGLAPGLADDGWGQFDQSNPDRVRVGLIDEAKRSAELFQGYLEGSGISLLETGQALIDVAKNPAAFIAGVKALITSPEARAQFGADILNKVQTDVRMLEDAFNSGDLRGTGQSLGKLVTDAAQLAGGVEALARLGVSTASAGGRVLVNATQVMTTRVAQIRSAFGGAQISDDVAMRIANNFGRDGDTFTQAAEQLAAARNAGWRTPDDKVWWPPSDGAVPGTQVRTTLEPGARLDRFGGTSPSSSFLSPVEVPIGQRALRPGVDLAVRDEYVVVRPFAVEQSNVMPWFGQPGMGIQFDTARGIGMSIADLERLGFIKKVGP